MSHMPGQPKRGARGEQGFTFAEMLASLLFVAMVIPVAIQGVVVAHRSAVLADHKWTAAHLADRLLNEMVVTEQWSNGLHEGRLEPDWPGYRWMLEEQSWSEGNMVLLTMVVFFTVQDREFNVSVSTLVNEPPSLETEAQS